MESEYSLFAGNLAAFQGGRDKCIGKVVKILEIFLGLFGSWMQIFIYKCIGIRLPSNIGGGNFIDSTYPSEVYEYLTILKFNLVFDINFT